MGMVLEAYWKGGPCKKSLIIWMYFLIKHLVERHEGKNSTQLPDAINPHVVVIISGLCQHSLLPRWYLVFLMVMESCQQLVQQCHQCLGFDCFLKTKHQLIGKI